MPQRQTGKSRIRLLIFGGLSSLTLTCGGENSAPTTATPSIAAISVTSVNVQSQKLTAGFSYTLTVGLKETAGIAATVSAVDLSFSADGTVFGTSHFDAPFASKVPADGTESSKSMTVNDSSANDPFADHVSVLVSFTDDNQHASTATGASTVLALPAAPVVTTFSVSPSSVKASQASTLQWAVSNAASLQIDNGIGNVAASGQETVTPNATTTYNLTAANAGGTTTASTVLTVTQAQTTPPTIASFTASPTTIAIGSSITLSWIVSNATSVSISNGVGAVGNSGQQSVTPLGDTQYVLTASNSGTVSTASVSVHTTVPSGICPASSVASGVTAVCSDGASSMSQHRQGTCSSHGGVSCWICPGVLCSGAPEPLLTAMARPSSHTSGFRHLVEKLFLRPNNGRSAK
jgi:hypothetical protein